MLKVERKVFEKVIVRIIRSTDRRELIEEFSKDPVFFCFVLRDISRGKDSPNYHVLKELTRNKEIIEQFIVEQAKSILSYFEEDYYRILNVSPTASAEEVRKNQLNLTGAYHPDNTKKSNGDYEVLRDPIEGSEYDARRFLVLPVMVKEPWWVRVTSKKFAYPVLLTFGILVFIFYIGETRSSIVDTTPTVVIKEPPSTKPEKKEKEVGMFHTEKSERIPTAQEIEEIPKEEKKGIFQSKEVPKLAMEEIPTEEPKRWETAREEIQNQKEMIVAQKQVEGQEKSPQPEAKSETERKPPVRIEELLTSRNKWTLDFNISYSNIDSTAERIELIPINSGGQNILFPIVLDQKVDQDLIIPSLSLRYGITNDLEVFAFASLFANFQRVSFNEQRESDFDFNFNSAGVGATYQVLKENKYPGLLISASTNIMENTDFGIVDTDSSDDIDLRNDFKINYFKTFSVSLTSFYTVDPIVFFLQANYIQNLKREDKISINPGEVFLMSPQIIFVVNPYINLSGGLRFFIQGKDKINGENVNLTRTRLSPLFGFAYEIRDNLILSLNTEYINDANFNRATASLRFTYRF